MGRVQARRQRHTHSHHRDLHAGRQGILQRIEDDIAGIAEHRNGHQIADDGDGQGRKALTQQADDALGHGDGRAAALEYHPDDGTQGNDDSDAAEDAAESAGDVPADFQQRQLIGESGQQGGAEQGQERMQFELRRRQNDKDDQGGQNQNQSHYGASCMSCRAQRCRRSAFIQAQLRLSGKIPYPKGAASCLISVRSSRRKPRKASATGLRRLPRACTAHQLRNSGRSVKSSCTSWPLCSQAEAPCAATRPMPSPAIAACTTVSPEPICITCCRCTRFCWKNSSQALRTPEPTSRSNTICDSSSANFNPARPTSGWSGAATAITGLFRKGKKSSARSAGTISISTTSSRLSRSRRITSARVLTSSRKLTWGWRWRKAASRCGVRYWMLLATARRSSPCKVPCRASSCISRISSRLNISVLAASSRFAASVRYSLRPTYSNNGWPTSSSSWRICRLTAGWVRAISSAVRL